MSTEWWGEFEASDLPLIWQIGPMALRIRKEAFEWWTAVLQGDDPFDTRVVVPKPGSEWPPGTPANSPAKEEFDTETRFAVEDSVASVELVPALADRAVVVRLRSSMNVPAGSETTLYVSTPVWIQVRIEGVLIHEFPTFRPKDTWFGNNTRVGEICYATAAPGETDADSLARCPHRAVTSIRVRNRTKESMVLERIKLPMRSLALYADGAALHTDGLTLDREEGKGQAIVNIEETMMSASWRKLAPARQAPGRNVLMDVFSDLLIGKGGLRGE